MNDQQTKYIKELESLERMVDEIEVAATTAESTMPYAATLLGRELVRGMKVNEMDADQKFFYKKFNLRIRAMVALRIAAKWGWSEIDLHKAMAPTGVAKQTVADLAAIQAGLDDCNGTAE